MRPVSEVLMATFSDSELRDIRIEAADGKELEDEDAMKQLNNLDLTWRRSTRPRRATWFYKDLSTLAL